MSSGRDGAATAMSGLDEMERVIMTRICMKKARSAARKSAERKSDGSKTKRSRNQQRRRKARQAARGCGEPGSSCECFERQECSSCRLQGPARIARVSRPRWLARQTAPPTSEASRRIKSSPMEASLWGRCQITWSRCRVWYLSGGMRDSSVCLIGSPRDLGVRDRRWGVQYPGV